MERFYRIAGHVIRLRLAGPTLIHRDPLPWSISRSLLGEDTGIHRFIFDSASTKTLMPSPPWSTEDYWSRGEIRVTTRTT
jgi:hypothetical protein